MHDPLDIDQLLARLRAVAAEHADPDLTATIPAHPWLPPSSKTRTAGHTDSPGSVRHYLLTQGVRNAGLTPYWLLEADHFVTAAYYNFLGRNADPQGRAHLHTQLARHIPRTEILAELILSEEALRLHPEKWKAGRWLGRILHLLMNAPIARSRTQWLVRGILRRSERWLAKKCQKNAFALAWGIACTQDALLKPLHEKIQEQQDELDNIEIRLRTQGLSAGDAEAVDRFFVAFEKHFRGDEKILHTQLSDDYLDLLYTAKQQVGDLPCLDLGCGRGVWLRILREAGFTAKGVDLNPGAIAQAQSQGLEVQVADALAWLVSQPNDSALAVTAFHLVEHIPFAVRLALTQEAVRVLAPGGVLIYETPNPENIWVGTHTFYHDPTHTQPLTPESLAFLTTYCGLEGVKILRLHPYPKEAAIPGVDALTARVNGMTCNAQDFAVVAQKPLPSNHTTTPDGD